MELHFTGELDEVHGGLAALLPEMGVAEAENGLAVAVRKALGGIAVGYDGRACFLQYEKKHQFFRALGLLLDGLRAGSPFELRESQQFDTVGMMFDCSRNAVLKPDAIRYFLRKMALMGLNLMMIYTEDTYEVPGEPYFGYLCGRYSHSELKACDDYADLFGIEMALCIQTLAHLEQFLKWPAAAPLQDTEEILLADSDATYTLIGKLIRAASAPLRSKRIHIGMDEAHALGLGQHLRQYGYEKPFEIMQRHIGRVLEITDALGLKPMMWSDMFFRMHNGGGYYNPELELPEETVKRVPPGVTQVYWDYYHHDEAFYTAYLRQHKRFGHTPVFAGGICTWTGTMTQNFAKTLAATTAGLAACQREGVREVFAAIWNDNGGECNYLSALNGMQLWAELSYAEGLDPEKLVRRTAFCCGAGYAALEDLCAVDRFSGGQDALEPQNPSKYLLWQDLLLGLFDRHVEDEAGLQSHYRELAARLRAHRGRGVPSELAGLFAQIEALCEALELKCTLGLRIRAAYRAGDKAALEALAREDLPRLDSFVRTLRLLHRQNWFALYKPFGWEVMDIRYGGLLMRIDSVRERLKDYAGGRVERLEELEEEKLPFDGAPAGRGGWIGHFNRYSRIVTANSLG